jgi:hypothetical protein
MSSGSSFPGAAAGTLLPKRHLSDRPAETIILAYLPEYRKMPSGVLASDI